MPVILHLLIQSVEHGFLEKLHDSQKNRPIRPIESLTFEECPIITLRVRLFDCGQLAKMAIALNCWEYFDIFWHMDRYRQAPVLLYSWDSEERQNICVDLYPIPS